MSIEDMEPILIRLDEIIKLLKSSKNIKLLKSSKDTNADDIIKYGDKVIYEGTEYYYMGYHEDHHVLGDRFLRAMIGVENGDLIKKAVSKHTHWHPCW